MMLRDKWDIWEWQWLYMEVTNNSEHLRLPPGLAMSTPRLDGGTCAGSRVEPGPCPDHLAEPGWAVGSNGGGGFLSAPSRPTSGSPSPGMVLDQ